MHALFGLEIAVRVLSLDGESDTLESGVVARERIDHRDLVAVAFGIAGIHAIEHADPILRLCAARARVQRHDRVVAVVFAVEQGLQAQFLRQLVYLRHLRRDLFLLTVRAALETEVDQHLEIVGARDEFVIFFELAVDRRRLSVDRGRLAEIGPKALALLLCGQFGAAFFEPLDVESLAELLKLSTQLSHILLCLFYKYHLLSCSPSAPFLVSLTLLSAIIFRDMYRILPLFVTI